MEPATATVTTAGPVPGQGAGPGAAVTPGLAPGGGGAAVRVLTVLYDAGCPLCAHIRQWLLGQRWLVPLRLVPAASAEARRRFPELDHASTLREITVIGDSGQVWRGTDAFVVCLWALTEHRPKANWLATPAGRPFARATMAAASAWREAVRPDDGYRYGYDGRADDVRAAEAGGTACGERCDAPR